MGFAVMLMGEDASEPPRGRRAPMARLIPIFVPARTRR
jgi:hypothetical protein